MRDLRNSINTNQMTEKKEYRFSPMKWFRRNLKNIMRIILVIILLNVIFNPGGVSSFISNWLSEFTSNWKID